MLVKLKIKPMKLLSGLMLAFSLSLVNVRTCPGAFEGLCVRAEDWFENTELYDNPVNRGEVILSRDFRYALPELSINRFQVLFVHKRIIGLVGWSSTGDDLYQENRFRLGIGYNCNNFMALSLGDVYNLYIKDYGSATVHGMGLLINFTPITWFNWSAGVEGLLTGRIIDVRRHIEQNIWSCVTLRCSNLSVAGIINLSREKKPGIALLLKGPLIGSIRGGFLVADQPDRFGGSLELPVSRFVLTVALVSEPPLGWTQRYTVRFRW